VVAPNPTGNKAVRMLTANGVSGVSAGTVLTSLVVFTLLYGALAVVWFGLMRRYAGDGAPAVTPEPAPDELGAPLSFAY
jgi:cytochrome d ubiquinol oxidase subunit I